jgi:hypothetical protein
MIGLSRSSPGGVSHPRRAVVDGGKEPFVPAWIAPYVFYAQHMMTCGEYAVTIKP